MIDLKNTSNFMSLFKSFFWVIPTILCCVGSFWYFFIQETPQNKKRFGIVQQGIEDTFFNVKKPKQNEKAVVPKTFNPVAKFRQKVLPPKKTTTQEQQAKPVQNLIKNDPTIPTGKTKTLQTDETTPNEMFLFASNNGPDLNEIDFILEPEIDKTALLEAYNNKRRHSLFLREVKQAELFQAIQKAELQQKTIYHWPNEPKDDAQKPVDMSRTILEGSYKTYTVLYKKTSYYLPAARSSADISH